MKQKLLTIFLPLILGSIVGVILIPFMDYDFLARPPFSPPAIVFPIAWTIIYLFMGISNYFIKEQTETPNIYYLQLAVNLLWPIFFFVFKIRTFAFLWILLLIVLVANMIYQFYQIQKKAAYFQIPYFLWLLFASYLNLGIVLLN